MICLLAGQEQVLNPEGLTAKYFSRVYSLLRAFDIVHFVSHPTDDDDDDTIFHGPFFDHHPATTTIYFASSRSHAGRFMRSR